jgi:hypothetical protein
LLAAQRRLDALVLMSTAVWDRQQQWRTEGHLTAAAGLRADGVPSVDAGRTVRAARLVDRCERLGKALVAGDVTVAHVTAIARRVTPDRAELFDQHSDALVDAACHLSADDTGKVAARWASYADDLLGRGEPDDIDGRRGFWGHPVGGNAAEGKLYGHPDDMAALLAALDRLQPPDAKSTPGGARSVAQRRYDALMQLVGLGLADSNGRIDPAHTINIVIDAQTLAGGFDPDGRSDIAGFSSILPTRVQQLLCNSWISRVIMDSKGQPLELGRRSRFFTPAQHQAITIRDGGCAIAGCDRPPHWCDSHHVDPWAPPVEGETNIDNGISLCRGHHTHVHNGWTLHPNPDGTWHLEPP